MKTNKKFLNMTKAEIKGYQLSTDYKKLWELIQKGFRIPAWIVYPKGKKSKEPIYDLVEVKIGYMCDKYLIGSRGIGYETFENTYEQFEMIRKTLELQWVFLR